MGAESERGGSVPEPSGEDAAMPVRLGDAVEDTARGKVGRVMGFVGPYVQVRPVGGGVEWDARPELLRRVTGGEALRAGVSAANARSRGERL